WASEAAKPFFDYPLFIDGINRIVTGEARCCDKKAPVRAECQMIGRDRRLKHRKGLDMSKLRNSIYSARSVTYIHDSVAVKGDSRRDTKTCCKFDRVLTALDTANHAVIAICNEELAAGIERETGRIHYANRKLINVAIRLDTKKCDLKLLAARTRSGHDDRIVIWIDSWVGDDMHVLGQPATDSDRYSLALFAP